MKHDFRGGGGGEELFEPTRQVKKTHHFDAVTQGARSSLNSMKRKGVAQGVCTAIMSSKQSLKGVGSTNQDLRGASATFVSLS